MKGESSLDCICRFMTPFNFLPIIKMENYNKDLQDVTETIESMDTKDKGKKILKKIENFLPYKGFITRPANLAQIALLLKDEKGRFEFEGLKTREDVEPVLDYVKGLDKQSKQELLEFIVQVLKVTIDKAGINEVQEQLKQSKRENKEKIRALVEKLYQSDEVKK
jgi:hypothetical protein